MPGSSIRMSLDSTFSFPNLRTEDCQFECNVCRKRHSKSLQCDKRDGIIIRLRETAHLLLP